MLNLLENYRWRSLPEWGDFSTNPNLRKKVGEAGEFLSYYGNTVVFLLEEKTKETLQAVQNRLHAAAAEMLAQPLAPATFHMTLHDLANGNQWTEALAAEVERTEGPARERIASFRELPPLKMRGTWLFNMVSTSVVLGLEPADPRSFGQLEWMYRQLEQVVLLGYDLTPHITMAYFRPGTYAQETLSGLRQVLGPVELEIELPMENLVYQTFEDMNHYL